MLNELQTTGMLTFAGLRPSDRAAYLQQVIQRDELGGFNNGDRGLECWSCRSDPCGSDDLRWFYRKAVMPHCRVNLNVAVSAAKLKPVHDRP